VSRRLIKNLSNIIDSDLRDITDPAIIVTRDLPLSDLSALEQENVLGFATEVGGRTSHVGLLARSLELPAVVGLGDVLDKINTGDIAIIDGEESILIINPSDNQLNEYKNKLSRVEQQDRRLIKNKDLPAVTKDDFEVHLFANIDLPGEVESALGHGALGIGLFRSEFMFIQKPELIKDEEAHYNLYKKLVSEVSPLPATIRILDIGSDKHLHTLRNHKELNPALGLRAIRLFLKDRDVIIAQLKGMLRASAEGDLRILIPFVSGLTEVFQIKEIIEEIKAEFTKKNIPFRRDIKIGLMIEIPSAALIADKLAKWVDFFSVGTNDLIQYTLAIDRANEKVSYLYRPLHPAIIKLLSIVIKAGIDNGIPVTVCGEIAGDPISMVVLLGMHYSSLSMNAVAIPLIKNIIRSFSLSEAEMIVNEVMRQHTAKEAEEYILEQLTHKFPAGYPM
jgi:phosphotransferase system enzyme I (PtsI)